MVCWRRPARILLVLLLLALAPPAVGEEAGEAPPQPDPPQPVPLSVGPSLVPLDAPWRPPERDEERRDWLVLSSGEWLAGEIELISDEVVYFDSKELDDLEIDWDDVATSAPRPSSRSTSRSASS